MNTRDDPPTTRTNATVFEAPALIPIGDAENVVLGIPWNGDEYIGFIPPRFEFQEDIDEEDISPAERSPGENERHDTSDGVPRYKSAAASDR